MSESLFRKEAIEHKRERLWGNVIVIQPLSFTVLSIVISLVVGLIVALLLWGNYARRETVNGYLAPNTGLSKIYAKNNGIVTKILVKEGEYVKAGSPLLTVSTGRSTEDSSDLDAVILVELDKNLLDAQEKMVEEKELSDVEKSKLNAQIDGLKIEIDKLKIQLATTKERFSLAKKRVDKFESLRLKGHVSTKEFDEQYLKYLDNKLRFNETERQLSSRVNALTTAEYELKQIPVRLIIQLTDSRNIISEIKQRRFNIEGQRTYTLYAPSSGKVTALQAHEGKTVATNALVLAILPEGAEFVVKLFVPTRAIGFVQKNQKIMIRYTAFPYQRFGVYEGYIEKVAEVILSPDELPVPVSLNEPVYKVTAKLDHQNVQAYGQELPLQSGMLLEADIILDSLSLIDWLLDPLYSLKGV